MGPSGSIRILYMEDDAGLARLFQRTLSRSGYVVDTVPDGEQGLAAHRAGSYDILAVDHKMPGKNGIEVIRELRTEGLLPPTIMITGAGDERVAVEAMKLGAADYIIKDGEGGYLSLMPLVIERALAKQRLVEEKEAAEKAFRQSEEMLRLIMDAVPACIAYVSPDRRYAVNNRTYEKWFGIPVEDLKGRHIIEIEGESSHGGAHEAVEKVLSGEACSLENRVACADGGARDVNVIFTPHVGDQGEIKGFVVLATDVTEIKAVQHQLSRAKDESDRRVERRTSELALANEELRREIVERTRAERELRKSEERFRAIFETAQDCIFVKDRSHVYTHVNPAMENLLALPASQIVGRKDEDLFGPSTARHLEDVERRVLAGQLIDQENTRLVRGVPLIFHDIRVPLRTAAGEIVGLCGISRDITERRKSTPTTFDEIKPGGYASPAIKNTMAKAKLAAKTESIILLLGESGSGKDYLARYIHENSNRKDGPYFAINCAAVAPEIAEAELFGHEAGAFTGAVGRKRGLLELAEGGTLLLNEIGELPLRLQAKLLTFLDTRSITRVGGETNVPVNARLMAATNRDLEAEAAAGKFRRDLFYRLNVLSITVPPLRDRPDDIPVLAAKIVEQLAVEMQLHQVPVIDQETLKGLAGYAWPGNVRELRNVLERALILSGTGTITLTAPAVGNTVRADWSYVATFPEDVGINEAADEMKRALIAEALRRSGGSKQHAADLLGISRYSLFRMLKALGIAE
ncbi:MAG: sigma 54-interacting transcriptional regulator [Pseudomonadota bacterium]